MCELHWISVATFFLAAAILARDVVVEIRRVRRLNENRARREERKNRRRYKGEDYDVV